MVKNRNGPNRKYGKRIELRTEQDKSNKTETAVYRFSPNFNYENLHRMHVFVYDGDHETMSQNRNTGSGYDSIATGKYC